VRWLWPKRIPLGKVTILAGDPGVGKSFVTLDIAARVSRGKPWADKTTPLKRGSVLLLSAEDGAGDTIRPRLEDIGADLDRIHVIDGVRRSKGSGESTFALDRDLVALERKLRALRDVRLVIIDPITAYLGRDTDSHKNADVRALLAPLASLAERHKVAILCVTHLSKGSGGKALYRATGSLAFVAAARASWLMTNDPDDPERRLVLPVKNNLSKTSTGLACRISKGRVQWEKNPVFESANEILAAEEGNADEAVDKCNAKEFLLSCLTDGPLPSLEVIAQGKENGFSLRTLKRAKQALGIRSTRVEGIAERGHWQWELPAKEARIAKAPT
jgi:RecA-family ATPase